VTDERRRYYRAGDLPRSGSPSDDPATPWHHRGELLTWNGETLTVATWSQRSPDCGGMPGPGR